MALRTMSPGRTERSLVVHRLGAPGIRPKAYLQAAIHAELDDWSRLDE